MSTSTFPQLGPVPDALLDAFEIAFREQQQATLRVWQLAAQAHDATAFRDQEFVADELALLMNVHPRTGMGLMAEAVQAARFPALLREWAAGNLTDRHVRAALDELTRCLRDDLLRTLALDRVLTRCHDRAARGVDWPRPGELRRMIRAAALLLDLDAHRQREESARDDRGAHCYRVADGQAGFAVEGPAEQVLTAADAVRARALAASRLPGETRTLAQLEFDLTVELLLSGTCDGSGPAAGVEVQVLVPVDTLTDGDDTGDGNGNGTGDEDGNGDGDGGSNGRHGGNPGNGGKALAGLIGYGPVHPQTARDLAGRATSLRRIDVDRLTGRVVSVGDRVPTTPSTVAIALATLLAQPLPLRDLSSNAYRPTSRALRYVQTRDQTCRFPGCTRRADQSDLDHLDPWPRGHTDPSNLHSLCRHHHRAKQSGLFTIRSDPDGTTIWTLLRNGRDYRQPPPDLTAS